MWSNTFSQTVALFDRPLPFAAGDKTQFHHLPGGQSKKTSDCKKCQQYESAGLSRHQKKHNNDPFNQLQLLFNYLRFE